MKRFHSIKKNGDFQLVYGMGKSYANKFLVMYVRNTGLPCSRIGISVSKKVGNSVDQTPYDPAGEGKFPLS